LQLRSLDAEGARLGKQLGRSRAPASRTGIDDEEGRQG
jgi:hypothetical protein